MHPRANIMRKLFKKSEIQNDDSHKRIRIGEQIIVLNSRGRIPVILQKLKRKNSEVIDLIYMNEEALKMSLYSGEVHVYRRSKQKVERYRSHNSSGLYIRSIKSSKNGRTLLLTISTDRHNSDIQVFVNEIGFKKYQEE
jgi:phosphoribosyl-AMP cyclohydrolase